MPGAAALAAALVTTMVAGSLAADAPPPKLRLDLSAVDARGLTGPPDGLRAVHYEFCIPDHAQATADVTGIDPTARLQPRSRGRIGCAPDQILVIGSTHQPGYREVLARLAALPYVSRIEPAVFE
jgi:hypothetical protein